MKSPIMVFCVSASTDEILRQALERHLALLKRQGKIASWQESEAGAMWKEEREQGFKEASLILLLISADFLASDACYEEQMQRALERQIRGEVKVLPILLRPVELTNAPFAHLPIVPMNRQAVTLWANQDAAWAHITEAIRCVLEDKPLPHVGAAKEVVSVPGVAEKQVWMVPYARNPFALFLIGLAVLVVISGSIGLTTMTTQIATRNANATTTVQIFAGATSTAQICAGATAIVGTSSPMSVSVSVPAQSCPPGVLIASLSYGETVTISASAKKTDLAYYGDDNSDPLPCRGPAWTDPRGQRYINKVVLCTPLLVDTIAPLPTAPIGALLYGIVCDRDRSHADWYAAFKTSSVPPLVTQFIWNGSLKCSKPHQAELYLLYNDTDYSNNTGSYSVYVQISRD